MLVERFNRLAFDAFDARAEVFELRIDLFAPGFELVLFVELGFEIRDILRESVTLALKAIALLIVCVFLLTPGMLSLWFIPIMLAVDAVLLLTAFILALITPSHVGSTRYLRRRGRVRNGIDPVQRDPFYRPRSAAARHRPRSQSQSQSQSQSKKGDNT